MRNDLKAYCLLDHTSRLYTMPRKYTLHVYVDETLTRTNPKSPFTDYEELVAREIQGRKELTLYELYKEMAEQHNKLYNDGRNSFMDAGFDILTPDNAIVCKEEDNMSSDNVVVPQQIKLMTGIRCRMVYRKRLSGLKDQYGNPVPANKAEYSQENPAAFTMHPRSSTGSKTLLRLANSTGIIDSGYRGELMGVFDSWDRNTTTSEAYSNKYSGNRLLQICAPSLEPFDVVVHQLSNKDEVDEFVNGTTRGSGGFGSTGK